MIRDHFNLALQKGQFGVEIELETPHADHLERLINFARPYWRVERDGSLRDNACELVFPEPLNHRDTNQKLAALDAFVNNNKLEFPDTGRAGVHVHVNMQTYTMTQVFNILCLYLIFEESLLKTCGDWRVGNLFCLGARDAEGMIDHLTSCIRNHEWGELATDDIRYAAVNLNSLPRYGSLEFRAMRSTTNAIDLGNWISYLDAIVHNALKYNTPEDVVMAYSMQGAQGLYDRTFGHLMERPEFDPDAMLEGMTLAQMLAFATDWSTVKEPEPIDYDYAVARAGQAMLMARDAGIADDHVYVEWLGQAIENVKSNKRLPRDYAKRMEAYTNGLLEDIERVAGDIEVDVDFDDDEDEEELF